MNLLVTKLCFLTAYSAYSSFIFFCTGVVLAILEKAQVISPIYSDNGLLKAGVGTVSAGYQNFFICIEMLLAAIALRLAFPHSIYSSGPTSSTGKTVSLQSISSSLKETMNPRDIMQDAIHNFHPNYSQYTQQGSKIPQEEEAADGWPYRDQYQNRPTQNGVSPANNVIQTRQHNLSTTTPAGGVHRGPPPNRRSHNEKTTLLSSDDEFQ